MGHLGMHDAKDGTTMAWADLPIHRLKRKAILEAQNPKKTPVPAPTSEPLLGDI